MPPQSFAERRTNMGLSCLPFLFTINLMIRSRRGTWLFTALRNSFSKITSSLWSIASANFIRFGVFSSSGRVLTNLTAAEIIRPPVHGILKFERSGKLLLWKLFHPGSLFYHDEVVFALIDF